MRVILVGGDETVYFLTKQFIKRRYKVTIINRNVERSRDLAEKTNATVVHGEGSDIKVLEESEARSTEVLIAMTPHDQDNLIICQLAQEHFGVPRVIAVVNDPDNEEVFRKLGVSLVFSPTHIIGTMIDQETTFEDITDLIPLAQGRLHLTDVRIDEEAPALGKTLSELDLTEGSLVVGIIRNNQVFVPHGSTKVQKDDHLLLVSDTEHQEENLKLLCNQSHASNGLFT